MRPARLDLGVCLGCSASCRCWLTTAALQYRPWALTLDDQQTTGTGGTVSRLADAPGYDPTKPQLAVAGCRAGTRPSLQTDAPKAEYRTAQQWASCRLFSTPGRAQLCGRLDSSNSRWGVVTADRESRAYKQECSAGISSCHRDRVPTCQLLVAPSRNLRRGMES